MNRKVLDALTTLQGEQSLYFPVDAIVQEVTLGMSCTDDLASVERGVRRSLASLTRHGLVDRSDDSYTRCQLPERISRGGGTKMPAEDCNESEENKAKRCKSANIMCISCRQAVDTFYKTYKRLRTESHTLVFNADAIGGNQAVVEPYLATPSSFNQN